MVRWNYVKIGDVCTVERGGSPRPIDKFITDDPNGINWIKIGDATDSMYITETAQKIIPEGMKKSRYVQPGDFLLSNSMSFGRPYILKIDGCIHDGWLVLRDNGGVFDKRFLYYYLSSPSTYQKFKNMAVGGVVNNLNSDMVRGVTVPIPKMEEQIEIVQTLDNVSNLIFLRKQQLAKLDELVKARFVEMFGDPELNPRGLPVLPWNAVFLTTTGKLDSNAMVENGRYPFFTCAKESYKIDSYAFDCEALLLAGNNAAGIYDVKHYKGKFNAYQRTYVLRLMNEKWSYILFKRQLEDKLQYLQSQSKGTNTRYLTLGILNELRFVVPPVAEQEQFAVFVEQTDKSKVAVQKALDEAQLLFDSLMQKYFG